MAASSIFSAIDDSSEIVPAQYVGGPRLEIRRAAQPARHWGEKYSVCATTKIGSGVDDGLQSAYAGRAPGGTNPYGPNYYRPRHISGSVLGRLARATAVDRERDRRRLETVAEVAESEAEAELPQAYTTPQDDRAAKFYVPKFDGVQRSLSSV
jgi:hypothetical protein